MAERRPPLLGIALLIAAVLIGAGVGGGFLYEFNHPKPGSGPRTVAVGDNVTVNYIGLFASSPQAGKVFDTSLYSVAVNNLSYPKSVEFSYRGSEAAYTPLPVYVGPSAPSGGYSLDGLTFGSVVTGFWQGLLGLPANQTSWITFPPALGYGPANPSCFAAQPLVFTVPVLANVSVADFSTAFPGANSTVGTEFPDPTYGWTDLVLSANATTVVVERLATLGWSVPGTGWPVIVTGVTASTITVTNRLTPANNGLVGGTVTTSGLCGATQFLVSSVNVANGTYTQDFNREVVGQSLTFEVTVVQFY